MTIILPISVHHWPNKPLDSLLHQSSTWCVINTMRVLIIRILGWGQGHLEQRLFPSFPCDEEWLTSVQRVTKNTEMTLRHVLGILFKRWILFIIFPFIHLFLFSFGMEQDASLHLEDKGQPLQGQGWGLSRKGPGQSQPLFFHSFTIIWQGS